MYTAERVAQRILMDIFAPFLLSHMTTLDLISFHKQLIVDTVQIVFLIFAAEFHFPQSYFQSFHFLLSK